MIDQSGEFGKRAARRLREESVIWLTTVDARGTPQPRPVWFLWNEKENSYLIFSQPSGAKVRHIQANPHVSLNLNSDEGGDDFVVVIGEAKILSGEIPPSKVEAYVKKYGEGMKSIGLTEEQFRDSYRTAIRVTPAKVRGF